MTTDIYSAAKRSQIMARVRTESTAPELEVRSVLHRAGFRFVLHRKDLPGRPDIVLPKYRTVVFVHGCFWHQHSGCRHASRPKQNSEFWNTKLDANKVRDRRVAKELRKRGWHVITAWECDCKNKYSRVLRMLARKLAK